MRPKNDHRLSIRFGLILGLVVAAGAMGSAARAQNNSTLSRVTKPVVQPPNTQTKSEPLPPAVPGSKPDVAAAAPAGKAVLDMPPTEALFDAINRGDLASAKDAISRGADLDGHNLLGMSPLDLSVDLGRNDISFLLLSLRGADSPPPGRLAASPLPLQKTSTVARVKQPVLSHDAPVASPAPRTPQLFAGSGGAPVPQAGFLGFGGAKQ
jgi:hypothetical protein